jgi:hypothetical protein
MTRTDRAMRGSGFTDWFERITFGTTARITA